MHVYTIRNCPACTLHHVSGSLQCASFPPYLSKAREIWLGLGGHHPLHLQMYSFQDLSQAGPVQKQPSSQRDIVPTSACVRQWKPMSVVCYTMIQKNLTSEAWGWSYVVCWIIWQHLTFMAISGWVPTCDSAHSWQLHSVAPLGAWATGIITW